MRLFIAINFNKEIKSKLKKAIAKLATKAEEGNFTKDENLHLTVVFIGETGDLPSVKQVMDGMNENCFEISTGKSGRFRRNGKDIYWVGIEECKALENIYKYLSQGLCKRGFKIEDREYRPHITLGREVICKEDIEVEKGSMTVCRISLMKSERVRGKLTYTEIYHKNLAPLY